MTLMNSLQDSSDYVELVGVLSGKRVIAFMFL